MDQENFSILWLHGSSFHWIDVDVFWLGITLHYMAMLVHPIQDDIIKYCLNIVPSSVFRWPVWSLRTNVFFKKNETKIWYNVINKLNKTFLHQQLIQAIKRTCIRIRPPLLYRQISFFNSLSTSSFAIHAMCGIRCLETAGFFTLIRDSQLDSRQFSRCLSCDDSLGQSPKLHYRISCFVRKSSNSDLP